MVLKIFYKKISELNCLNFFIWIFLDFNIYIWYVSVANKRKSCPCQIEIRKYYDSLIKGEVFIHKISFWTLIYILFIY